MQIDLRIERGVCVSCGVCVESCPTDVIRQDGEGKAHVVYGADCQACFLCVFDCPVEAITIRQLPPTAEHLAAVATGGVGSQL